MNILLDSNNIAFYIGQQFVVTDDCVILSDGSCNYSYNTSNTTVINAEFPTPQLDFVWKWEDNTWVCVNQEAIDAYKLDQKTAFNLSQKRKREAAYTIESDPIYFLWQRGEASQEEWLAKIAEIKVRFPYQE